MVHLIAVVVAGLVIAEILKGLFILGCLWISKLDKYARPLAGLGWRLLRGLGERIDCAAVWFERRVLGRETG